MRSETVSHIELVEVVACHRFAVTFGHAIEAVGTLFGRVVKFGGALVKPDGVVGTGKHDPLDPVLTRPFIQVIGPGKIGVQQIIKGRLNRNAAR